MRKKNISYIQHNFLKVQGRSWNSSISILTGLGAGGLGFDTIILFATVSRLVLGLSSLLSQGCWDLSSAVRRPGREADHSPLSSAWMNNKHSCVPLLPPTSAWRVA
jgi:hypothetical protein